MTQCEEFMDWLTDQQIVHWTLTEETKDDPIAAVKALLQTQLDETYDPRISALAAKAALADDLWAWIRKHKWEHALSCARRRMGLNPFGKPAPCDCGILDLQERYESL